MSETSQNLHLGDVVFPARKVWLKTFGCQMNYHDSERLLGHLSELNFTQTDEMESADLILFNTCAVRDLANQKFYSHLGETKRVKQEQGKKVVIGAGGCIAQTEGKELIKKYHHLDFTFGTDVIDQINQFVYRSFAGDSKFSVNTWDRSSDYSIETKTMSGEPRAFVNIIKGCDKFCSYCIVPFTRGREKSRKSDEIVQDVKRLVEHQGVQEIMLLGQNVNSYGKENRETLADLIYQLEKIDGLELIRYTTSHPYDMGDDLIQAHRDSKKLAPHVHLPVQSGSNTVLERMLREYSREHYLELLRKLRSARPDIVISSDIIVGFPNETQQEHQDTLDLLRDAQFDFIYSYAYSSRKGTKAARMKDFLTDDLRGERLRELQKFQLEIQHNHRKKMEGKEFLVWVDGDSNMKGHYKLKGRTPCSRIFHFEAPPGDTLDKWKWSWVQVRVTSSTSLSCQSELVHHWGKTPPTSAALWCTNGHSTTELATQV